MKNELINYAKALNAPERVLTWLDTHVLTQEGVEQSEVEHVIDYLVSDKAPKRLTRASLKQMKKKAEEWIESLNKEAQSVEELPEDVETILEWKDEGFRLVKLIGESAYKREGLLMRHCVASYYDKDDEIYSLRDEDNNPHATISRSTQQIKGKGNGSIHPKYVNYVVEFLEFLGIEVRDDEMRNLGYVNIENVKDENVDWGDNLFRGKYFPSSKVKEIKDKEGERYQSILLWPQFKLIINSNFQFSFNASLKTFFKKNKDYNTLAGRSFNILAGGDFNTLAGRNHNTLAGKDCNLFIMYGLNNVAIGRIGSIMMGKKGSLMVFVKTDEERNVIGAVTAMIDGKKIEEDKPYKLEGDSIVQCALNEDQKRGVREARKALKLAENIEEFYKKQHD